MPKLLILLTIFFLSSINATVLLTDDTPKYEHFTLQNLYDEIEETNFTQTILSQFTKGYRDGTAWFKISVKNKSENENFVIYFTEPFW